MAEVNISKIKIDENDLIIKDAQARENINKLYNINAENFSSNSSYKIGDYVLYNNSLYRFISSHTSSEWNSSHVIGVRLSSEIQQKLTDAPNDGETYARKNNGWAIISGEGSGGVGLGDTVTFEEDTAVITTGDRPITELYDMNSDEFSPGITYNIGDYTIYEGKLYKFIVDHDQLDWDDSHVERVNITNELKLLKTTDNITDKLIGWTQEEINQHLITTISDCNNFENTNFVTLTRFIENTPNAPTTSAGMLLDYKYTANIEVQLALIAGSKNIYIRSKISGNWKEWNIVETKDTGWTSVQKSDIYSGTIYWRKVGKVVTILTYDNHLINNLTDTSIILCNIGSENTPSISNCYTRVGNANNAASDVGAFVRIETGGNLRFYKAPNSNWASTTPISFTITYIAE